MPHIHILPPAPEAAVSALWKDNAPLSHADAAAVVTAWREDADLLTADAKQRAAFRAKKR